MVFPRNGGVPGSSPGVGFAGIYRDFVLGLDEGDAMQIATTLFTSS
jgi:hypothetical protein